MDMHAYADLNFLGYVSPKIQENVQDSMRILDNGSGISLVDDGNSGSDSDITVFIGSGSKRVPKILDY